MSAVSRIFHPHDDTACTKGKIHDGHCIYQFGGGSTNVMTNSPGAINSIEGAKKFDGGKPPIELLSSVAIVELAKVLDLGKKKYGIDNWRQGLSYRRVLGAIGRHLFAYLGGESKDPESGLSHVAHIMAEAMFLLEFEVTHPELDDRFKPSSDASMSSNNGSGEEKK